MKGALPLILAGSLAGGVALAQSVSDPTRPPNAAATAQGAAPEATESSAPKLQSVLLSPRRKLAVISGQTVPLGGRLGDATLVKITETEVVLKRGDELETLRMHPEVEKKLVAGKKSRSKDGGEKQ